MTVFTAVVDAGSFVGAAEALGLSRAAVSRLVGELESRLGVRLLHRTTRRLSLTDEGRIFHLRCKAVLAEVEEAEAEVSARSGAARGLRIDRSGSFDQASPGPGPGSRDRELSVSRRYTPAPDMKNFHTRTGP